MTKLSGFFTALVFTIFVFSTFAQDTSTEVKEKFKVYGNCEMCKKTIDAAAKSVDGVKSAKWNIEAKTIMVKFDSSKTDLDAIKKAIANAGYDTEEFRAKDETYNALHNCCKYDRPAALNN